MNFTGRHIVSIMDFEKDEILYVLGAAKKFLSDLEAGKRRPILKDTLLATLFFEPSTRTKLSFEAAALRLGGQYIGFSDPKTSSSGKGETLADTIRTVSSYADAIVLRHPQEGAARLASTFSPIPVINAGDGAGQHPTQTLLDLMAIQEAKGGIEDQTVVLLGDLRYGRTTHSLAYALAVMGANIVCVTPPSLQMPKDVLERIKERGVDVKQGTSLDRAVDAADVLYVTRIQRERFPDPEEYRKVSGSYRIDRDLLKKAKQDVTILHPLPRVDEIAPSVDDLPNAWYFKQAALGLPMRMALLALVMGKL